MATVLLVRHGRSTANTGGVLAGHTPGVLLDEVGQQQAYGDWTGKELKSLTDDPMWKVVQRHPSAAVVPGAEGESLRDVQNRAVEAIREFNAELGDRAVYAVFSHGDVIKAILADALGLHLDQFQRIVVNPCSVSVVTYTPERPFVHRMNDTSGDFASFAPPTESDDTASDAVVGGGTGDGR